MLAVEMLDGSPHGATVHFAHTEDPLMFFFETRRQYRKAEPLMSKGAARATFVIGCDDNMKKTMQLDGEVRILKESEKEAFKSTYLEKFPDKKEKASSPDAILFVFIPKWWRFSDWTGPTGKVIFTSDPEHT